MRPSHDSLAGAGRRLVSPARPTGRAGPRRLRATRVELEALLRDLRPYLNGNSYRGKDSDETFDAWLQALADWSEGGEQPANLGKFGQTRISSPPSAWRPSMPR